MSVRLSLPAAEYVDPVRALQTFERMVESARRIPVVEAAGITSQVPLGEDMGFYGVHALPVAWVLCRRCWQRGPFF